MKAYVCKKCGWIYDPIVGDPEGGILPGVGFEEIPDDWGCPLCGLDSRAFIEEDDEENN
ncbi:MAG: rubredoxin [Phocaeicola sp.]